MINEKGLIELEGVIVGLKMDSFDVEITSDGFEGEIIQAKIAGKMRMHHIRIVEGDRVKVEVPPDEFRADDQKPKGRIIYRFRR